MKQVLTFLLLIVSSIDDVYPQSFTDVTDSAGIDHLMFGPMGGGAAVLDYNNDGHEDVYVIGGLSGDKLLKNNGDGTFSEINMGLSGLSAVLDKYTIGVAAGDINNDGNRDLFVTTWGFFSNPSVFASNQLFRNNGNGTFTNITNSSGISGDKTWSFSATFGDFNLDGYLDIYVGNYVDSTVILRDSLGISIGYANTCFPNYLYLNNGDETFTEVGSSLGMDNTGCALATAFTDYDADQDIDLYVANDFGEWVVPNVLYRNNHPQPNFADVSVSSGANAGMYGMGIGVGDYDEDGDFDYYVTNVGRNVLFQNNGDGTFSDVADSAGVANTWVVQDSLNTTGWGANFFDYDHDTYLDLFVSNGWIGTPDFIPTHSFDPNKFYENNRDGTFTDISTSAGVADTSISRGSVIFDYDNDGDMDLLVMNVDYYGGIGDTLEPKVTLLRNDAANGNWLKVKVQGVVNARDGFGTRARAVVDGRSFIREVGGGSGHASQNSSIMHFGLAIYSEFDTLEILWLGGGRQVFTCVSANQLFQVIEDTSAGTALLIVCPSDIAANTDSGLCGAIVDYNPPSGQLVAPGDTTVLDAGLGRGALFPVGSSIESYNLINDQGYSFYCCSFNIVVHDAEDPKINCPSHIVMDADSGMNGAVVAYAAPTGSDNCGVDTIILLSGLGSGAIFPVGVNWEFYEIVSITGQTASCSFKIEVLQDSIINSIISPDLGVMFEIYPNPVEEHSMITLVMTDPAFVELEVYNILGDRIEVLMQGYQDPGKRRVPWISSGSNQDYARGIYFLRLRIDDSYYLKKVVVR